MGNDPLRLLRRPDVWHAYRELWTEVTGQSLSFAQAMKYGPQILGLIGAVGRWKRSQVLAETEPSRGLI
jgi:hypothetical protein